MTTDPITMADLAKALREAVDLMRTSYVEEWNEDHQHIDRWRALLDRYVERLRGRVDANIRERDHRMQWMRNPWVDKADKKEFVEGARAANHRALRLRHELRALGGE